jgi:hypothetical protein
LALWRLTSSEVASEKRSIFVRLQRLDPRLNLQMLNPIHGDWEIIR